MSNRNLTSNNSTESSSSEELSPKRDYNNKKHIEQQQKITSIMKKKTSEHIKNKKQNITPLPGTSSADLSACDDNSATVEGLWKKQKIGN